MNNQLVEYRSKHHGGVYNDWTELTYNIPFKSLRINAFDIRVNGQVFTTHEDLGFKETYDNAMFWIRLKL